MNKRLVIRKTEEFVKKKMKGDSGHDWSHINRVRNSALYIAKKENADMFLVELGALLHDVADFKFNDGDDKASGRLTEGLLEKLSLPKEVINKIIDIVDNVSFKGEGVKSKMKSLEGKIVQDADRLDALGAIGIARDFVYVGYRGLPIYISGESPKFHKTFAHYRDNESSGITHFYEKLLLLKNLMNTKTAYKLARDRDKYMRSFLKQFYKEWNQFDK